MLRFTIISSAAFVLIIPEPVPAQVDTLNLTQISHIYNPTPGQNLTGYYAADVCGDSIKESILCTLDHAFIYNSLTGQLIWTSSPLIYRYEVGWQIQFLDMNDDGIPDLALRDTVGVYIFDIQHSQPIWTSPPFGQANLSFTLGDRNSDGHDDIVISRKTFDVYSGMDTISIEYYDGPNFTLGARHYFTVQSQSDGSSSRDETINRILLADLSGPQGLTRRLFVFTESSYRWWFFDGYDFWSQHLISGAVRIVNPITFDIFIANTYGSARSYSFNSADSANITLNVILKYEDEYLRNYQPWSFLDNERTVKFSAQGIIESQYIWYSNDRLGYYSVGEIMNSNPGDEFLYVTGDTLTLISYPSLDTLWTNETNHDLQHPIGILNLSSLYANPQMLFREPLSLFNCTDGNLRAIFSQPDMLIHQIVDLDDNGNDEVVSVTTQGLDIYIVDRFPVAVDDPENQPILFSLLPNHPNPFNPSTVIEYSLPRTGPVDIDIYNILGEKVTSLFEGTQAAGHHSFIWHAGNLRSGVYFARITAGGHSQAIPMSLVK